MECRAAATKSFEQKSLKIWVGRLFNKRHTAVTFLNPNLNPNTEKAPISDGSDCMTQLSRKLNYAANSLVSSASQFASKPLLKLEC